MDVVTEPLRNNHTGKTVLSNLISIQPTLAKNHGAGSAAFPFLIILQKALFPRTEIDIGTGEIRSRPRAKDTATPESHPKIAKYFHSGNRPTGGRHISAVKTFTGISTTVLCVRYESMQDGF